MNYSEELSASVEEAENGSEFEPGVADVLDLGSYHEALLQLEKHDKVDALYLLTDVLKAPQVLQHTTWHNIDALRHYKKGVAYDELVDRSVQIALEATKMQYHLEVRELVQSLNALVVEAPGLYGVRTHTGIDPFETFSSYYDEKYQSASLITQTKSGDVHEAIDRRRLVIDVTKLTDPEEIEAIRRIRSGEAV